VCTDVKSTTSIAELRFTIFALHVITTFCLLDVNRTLLSWTFLHESLPDQSLEIVISLLLLNIRANMTEGKSYPAIPADVKVAFVAPEFVGIYTADAATLLVNAVFDVSTCPDN
jgi:hypothetical protein